MDAMQVIWCTIGFLLVSLVSLVIWQFKRLSENQTEILKELQRNNIDIATEKVEKSSERKKNDRVESELRKSMSDLAVEMSTMAKNINSNYFNLQEHKIRISNLEDKQRIISSQLRKMA